VVLVNKVTKKVILLDIWKVRYNRMRERVGEWVRVLSVYNDIQFIMVTLTYAPEFDWQPNHIRSFMLATRKTQGEDLLGYAWIAELQKRGVIHYHVMLVVPTGLVVGDDLPYPDKDGTWPYGLSRVEVALTPFYLTKYLGKEYQKDFSRFPKGIRAFAVNIREADAKRNLRYLSLKDRERAIVDTVGWEGLKAGCLPPGVDQTDGRWAWELGSLESERERAIKRAENWEGSGHEWKGRHMFLGENAKL
jgi:hypothetical protein